MEKWGYVLTVEELIQELVELCQRGRAKWEVVHWYHRSEEPDGLDPITALDLIDERQMVELS